MKTLIYSLTLSLGVMASNVKAEQILSIDGTDYPLSTLMDHCRSMKSEPEAQIACFSALSKLLEAQSGDAQEDDASVTQALESLRAVAQYQDDGSGLSIVGSDCSIQIVYFDNYFHISRRNISTIDLFSTHFDASKLQYDKIAEVQDAPAPLLKSYMDAGATAAMRGGTGLESAQHNFTPKSPRTTIDAYANEVAEQLPGREDQTVEFVLVHPELSQTSSDIMSAFEEFVKACQA